MYADIPGSAFTLRIKRVEKKSYLKNDWVSLLPTALQTKSSALTFSTILLKLVSIYVWSSMCLLMISVIFTYFSVSYAILLKVQI